MQLMLQALATGAIADCLSSPALTVLQHLKAIFDKTGAGSWHAL
jgi:hypothetical protein